MCRIFKFMILFSAFLACSPAWSQGTKTVTAEGVAEIQSGAKDMARDAALKDAKKRAVEQAIGILIDTQTRVENCQLISDKILSQTESYIRHYSIAGESVEDTLLRVRINAEVSLGHLADDLSGIGILVGQTREAGGTRSVNITVIGLNKTQFVKFKDVLKNQVRSIKDLHERSFSGSTAKISVDVKGTAQAVSDELLLKDFGTFAVEVVGSTANFLELKVIPK
jgi:hypothetical protein